MTKFIDRRTNYGIARETSRGTLVAPSIWMRHTSADFRENFETLASEAGVGRIEQAEQSHLTRRMSEGNIEGEIGSKSFGFFLYSLLGSLSTAADTPVASTYTHTFTLAQTNQHTTLTLLKQDPDRRRAFTVMPTSTTITVEPGQIVTHSTDLMGLKGNDFTTQSVTYPSDIKFLSRGLEFKLAAAVGDLGAASGLDVKRLEVTISQNVMFDDQLGTIQPTDLINQQFDISGSVELNLENDTWRNYVRDNTNRAMQIKFTSEENITGSTPASLDLQFPNVRFFEWEDNRDLDTLVTQTLQFQAMYDMANSQASITTCQLINGQTSY